MLSSSAIRNLRVLEWIFLSIHILLEINSGETTKTWLGWLSIIIVYGIFFGLSFYFPSRNSFLQQLYLCSGLLLGIAANFIDVSTDFLVYLYVGKSSFFLKKKELLAVLILAGIGWVWSEVYSNTGAVGELIFNPQYGFTRNATSTVLGSSLGIYIGASIFVVSFCTMIVAEQKSRQRAESLLQQVEVLAKDLERARIARAIHDSLGHTLTNLNIQLQLAQRLSKTEPAKAFQSVDLAQMLSLQCIEDVSLSLSYIRQADFDLDSAIERLIHQLQENISIAVSVDMPSLSIPLPIRHQVYMILKECLVNVQKHSQASQIRLKGRVTKLGFCLELEDDGVGFVYQQSSMGFGLKGISERIQMLGGQLNINSVLGRGTLIQVEIPL
ncbi:MAG: sensor histidine kinase [Cyanobacteria bacterium P01_D01_bin.36]